MTQSQSAPLRPAFVEEVEIQGHIIDSLLLPKVLDEILTHGGSYVIKDIRIGQRQADPSYARIEVRAATADELREILDAIHDHGAVPVIAAGLHRRARRHGRRLSRRLLQHHQLSHPGPPRAANGSTSKIRRWTAASSSMPEGRPPAACR